LYKKCLFLPNQLNSFARDLQVHEHRFDLFCPRCDKESTWKLIVSEETARRYKLDKAALGPVGPGSFRGGPATTNWSGRFSLVTQCSRNPAHSAFYCFDTGSQPIDKKSIAILTKSNQEADKGGSVKEDRISFIQKIGQSPSLFDFQKDVLGVLAKGLNEEQAKDLVRATQTYTHGYAVAACVYLRRVFESILDQAKAKYMLKHELTTCKDYESEGTGKRIQLLKEYLPPFLVDHPHLYTLLSMGVHELSEKECSREFENLRAAIEMIIKEKISMMEEERRKEEISKLLSMSINQHANGD
jgi:hypothetical protein